jgi:Tfp pilus assembly protein PilZ
MTTTRRAHPRIETALRVSVKLANGEAVPTGQIRNVSLGGIFIETANPPAFGADLEIAFDLPEGTPRTIRCRGFVVWTTKTDKRPTGGLAGMGVRLSDIGVQEMRALSAFIAKHIDG